MMAVSLYMLLTVSILSLEKCQWGSFAHVLIGLFDFIVAIEL
jgi:hypothetical protein